jgi:C-terminal processing protease CtpA/Prc
MNARVKITIVLSLICLVVLGGFFYWYKHRPAPVVAVQYKTAEEKKDIYVRFDMEVYDKILQNYWDKIKDEDLASLFKLSLAKAASVSTETINLPTKDRAGTVKMLDNAISNLKDDSAKKSMALNTIIVALYNLQPAGRNGLLSSKQEIALRENVSNIDSSKNLYTDLGLQKGATKTEVDKTFQAQKAILEKDKSEEAKSKLKELAYARDVLTKDETKALYDTAQIEPTIFTHIVGGTTLYIDMSKVSPTTFDEFGKAIVAAVKNSALDSMVLDLRGNIGGSLDLAQYFLGLFLGKDQYAFDLYRQGDFQVQRTTFSKISELKQFREIAVLSDNATQSTAELLTAAFKHFNIARVVGTTTKGWGTVENTFSLDTVIDPNEKYSLFLVHSLTLRDDNQPIEGRGVDPDVDIKNPDWKSQLSKFFNSKNLINALAQIASQPVVR